MGEARTLATSQIIRDPQILKRSESNYESANDGALLKATKVFVYTQVQIMKTSPHPLAECPKHSIAYPGHTHAKHIYPSIKQILRKPYTGKSNRRIPRHNDPNICDGMGEAYHQEDGRAQHTPRARGAFSLASNAMMRRLLSFSKWYTW